MMKKTMYTILVTLVTLALLVCSAAAAKPGKVSAADVKADMEATASYVMQTLLNETAQGQMHLMSQPVAAVVKSGIVCWELTERYQTDLKAYLDQNGVYTGIGYCALAIETLEAIGLNPADFHGYNLFEMLNGLTPAGDLYQNAWALETVQAHQQQMTNEQLEQNLINALLSSFKEENGAAGWDNWGINADNNGTVIPALAPYYHTNNAVKEQIEKALAYNQTVKGEQGYENWGTGNINSTALVLEAFLAMEDWAHAAESYAMFANFRSSEVEGAYTYGGAAQSYASQGALQALIPYYNALLRLEEETTTEETTESTTVIPEETTTAVTTTVQETTMEPSANTAGKPVPATGEESRLLWAPVSFALLSGVAALCLRKRKIAE